MMLQTYAVRFDIRNRPPVFVSILALDRVHAISRAVEASKTRFVGGKVARIAHLGETSFPGVSESRLIELLAVSDTAAYAGIDRPPSHSQRSMNEAIAALQSHVDRLALELRKETP